MTDTELLLGVLRKLTVGQSMTWWESDLFYVDVSIEVTPEEAAALARFGVEPWTEIEDDE